MKPTMLGREADKPPSSSWPAIFTLSALIFAAFFLVSALLDRSWLADVGLVLAYPAGYAVYAWRKRNGRLESS